MNEIEADTSNYLINVVKSFSPGICHAFAYGSGVFKQHGHSSIKDNMIDLVFVVNDAFSWHHKNLIRYPSHYSFLKYLGAGVISKLQTNYGAKMYFNTLVDFNDRLIKYGVIEQKDFLKDMLSWESLYVAGRLHKPVLSLKGLDDTTISDTIELNLISAVETSLLTLPEYFSEEDLYMCIAGLSYTGDVRMFIAEDKKKVQNIVSPNLCKFQNLYGDIISRSNALHLQNGTIMQNLSADVQSLYIKRLPETLRNYIFRQFGINVKEISTELIDDTVRKISENRTKCTNLTLKGVQNIIRKSSTSQTLKGVVTSGLWKSIFYSLQKVKKMVKSLR